MIFDAIIGLFVTVLGAIIGGVMSLVPEPPTQLVTAMADAWDLMSEAYAMDHWLPIDLAFLAIAAVLAAYAASAMIGIVRLIVSYFTLGSGAT